VLGEGSKPSIRFYPGFPDDWEKLPSAVRAQLGDLLERLQTDPQDPELQSASTAHLPFFASELYSGYIVYWTLKFSDPSTGESSTPISIDVLQVGKSSELESQMKSQSTP
jgi:hypothetical protein